MVFEHRKPIHVNLKQRKPIHVNLNSDTLNGSKTQQTMTSTNQSTLGSLQKMNGNTTPREIAGIVQRLSSIKLHVPPVNLLVPDTNSYKEKKDKEENTEIIFDDNTTAKEVNENTKREHSTEIIFDDKKLDNKKKEEEDDQTEDHLFTTLKYNKFKKKKLKHYKLFQILSLEQSFKLFMKHLCREFSMEILLSFIEILQYKHSFKLYYDEIIDSDNNKNMDDNNAMNEEFNIFECPFFKIVPQSVIIEKYFGSKGNVYWNTKLKKNTDENNNNNNDLVNHISNKKELMDASKNVIYEIYNKYCIDGCSLHLNVSHETFNYLSKLLTNKDEFFEHCPNISLQDLSQSQS